MTFEIVSASNLPFDAQSEIFNRTFSGYLIGWSDIGVGGLAKLICVQGIDLCYRRFAITSTSAQVVAVVCFNLLRPNSIAHGAAIVRMSLVTCVARTLA